MFLFVARLVVEQKSNNGSFFQDFTNLVVERESYCVHETLNESEMLCSWLWAKDWLVTMYETWVHHFTSEPETDDTSPRFCKQTDGIDYSEKKRRGGSQIYTDETVKVLWPYIARAIPLKLWTMFAHNQKQRVVWIQDFTAESKQTSTDPLR